MPDSGSLSKLLRPLAQRRTWARAFFRVLAISLLPAGASLLAGEPLLAGYLTLWVLTVLIPSTLIEAVLPHAKRLSAPFPLAWTLFLINLILCLFGFFEVLYLMRDGPRPETASALVRFLRESPREIFLTCALFAVGLAVAGSFAQRKPAWRRERLGVGFFFLGAYLLTVSILTIDKFGDETALIGAITGWALGLAFLSTLFSLGYAIAETLERRILGAPELDHLADYLLDRLEERGPLQPPHSQDADGEPSKAEERSG